MLDKFEIADALREIALLLELKRENPFKARAYVQGASAVESINEEIGRVIDDGRLTNIRGIGDSLAHQIVDLYETGSSPLLSRLRREMPPGVVELAQIPGLSVKKIQALHEALGIKSIDELEAACLAGKVSSVKGFGEKTQTKLLQGIESYRTREQKDILLNAVDLIRHAVRYISGGRSVSHVEPAGDVRRWKEVVSDLAIVAATTDSARTINHFKKFPLASRMEGESDSDCIVRLSNGMPVHLLCAPPKEMGAAMLWHTGSALHIEQLQKLAHQQGYELAPRGLFKNGKVIPTDTESDIYERLGLPFIPPELREGEGEIEDALSGDTFDDLIRVEDIRGMTHCHTVYSDGKHSIEQMALAAEKMGMQYITITDHSPNASYAGGLDTERLKRQWDEIERVQENVRVRILRGTESDILEDGALDYPDWVLEKLDVIIASVHSRLRMDEDQMTKRLIKLVRQPQFKVWGHPLGRLLLRRDPLSCRIDEVLDAVAESRAAIEVNGDPYRLDMEPSLLRRARKRGIRFIISVDAHSTGALNYIRYGVHIGRRGGLRKADVLNALPVNAFAKAVKP